MNSRLNFVQIPPSTSQPSLAETVIEGLSRRQKSLPCRLFYDSAGSRLFEAICHLPEYYLTRAEAGILRDNAHDIAACIRKPCSLVDLGSGNGAKTRILIEALLSRQASLHYIPIDIAASFLRQASCALLDEYSRLAITALAGHYEDALPVASVSEAPTLFLFLGSNIGNFTPAGAVAFLGTIRRAMKEEDRLLIGIDLEKDRSIIEPAYNDAAEVTAAFNRNMLARINAELGGTFDVSTFEHMAPYLSDPPRVEMRLVSACKQAVQIRALDRTFEFEAREWIRTEHSHKYSITRFEGMCSASQLCLVDRWLDWRSWFAVMLLAPGCP